MRPSPQSGSTAVVACLIAFGVVACAPSSVTTAKSSANFDSTSVRSPLACDRAAPTDYDVETLSLHRLTNAEYDNAINDIIDLGVVAQSPSSSSFFPSDPYGDGFTHVADSLSMDALRMDKYLQAADAWLTVTLASTELSGKLLAGCETSIDRDCASKVLLKVARKAFRRPLKPDELNRYLALYDFARGRGDNLKGGIKVALKAVFSSPHFLFKISDPKINDAPPSFAVATVLASFLWGGPPDDRLLDLAESTNLADRKVLAQEAARMLNDPRSRRMVETLANEHLGIRELQAAQPDPKQFPDFDESLRKALGEETLRNLQAIKENNQSFRDILDSRTSLINQRLAKYYQVSDARFKTDTEWLAVDLSSTGRTGFLSRGTFLIGSSHAFETSPVTRGHFVLDRFMCRTPPPAPPDLAEKIEKAQANNPGLTARQRSEVHASERSCKTCHTFMDPVGLAFETLDAVGQWRQEENGIAIDTSGQLPTGETFQGPHDLALVIASSQDFRDCTASKFMTYALSRTLENRELCDSIDVAQATEGMRFQDLVINVAAKIAERIIEDKSKNKIEDKNGGSR